MLACREQTPGELDARGLTELMRRLAEDRLELPNQMKRRDVDLPRNVPDRERRLTYLEQQVARETQAAETFVPEEHTR
jgi:hypothetical protein